MGSKDKLANRRNKVLSTYTSSLEMLTYLS
jgi:hypothetical protein